MKMVFGGSFRENVGKDCNYAKFYASFFTLSYGNLSHTGMKKDKHRTNLIPFRISLLCLAGKICSLAAKL